jgi:cell division septation protein DedD
MPRRPPANDEDASMSDDNRAEPETMELADEDRLPWLEAVEEDGDRGGGPSVAKLIIAIVIGLVAIGVVVGGLWWIGNGNRADENTIITAEKGDYKQRPENPGGMNITGEGNTMFAASEGQQPRGNVNVNGVAEQPAAPAQGQNAGQQGTQGQQAGQPARPGPGQQAQAPARPAPTPPPARPAPQQPQRPAPAPSGPAIQLGAFSSPAAANNAWRNLAGRFRYLAPLSHHLVAVQAGGRTLHRLRASGPDSANICRRLQAAGEACTIVS